MLIGVAGGVVGEVLKFGLTGKHLSPLETFQNVFVTGILAATATSMALLGVPTSGVEILKLCSFTSATFAVLFHVSNAYVLSTGERHLSAVASWIILGTPFVFSGLLLVGSGKAIANLSAIPQFLGMIFTTVVSQAGIWVEAYLLTGMLMDGIHGKRPSAKSVADHCRSGLGKGMVYSGVFMTLLHGLNVLIQSNVGQWLLVNVPWLMAAAFGACFFHCARPSSKPSTAAQRSRCVFAKATPNHGCSHEAR